MKYCVVLIDGMADVPLPSLEEKTPLEVAKTPCLDGLSKTSEIGIVQTIPEGMSPGSDVANLGLLGYPPDQYHTGRSAIEAENMKVELSKEDLSLRCNLVTLSEGATFKEKKMLDYSGGKIDSQSASILIEALDLYLKKEGFDYKGLYPGLDYRHLWVDYKKHLKGDPFMPPHDILNQPIGQHLGQVPKRYVRLMEKSHTFLSRHPLARKTKANGIWFWGKGEKIHLPAFHNLYGLKGGVISAVDLIQGIARAGGMEVIHVEGMTGKLDTNFKGKAQGAIKAFKEGLDYVYIHLEAPDECSHQGDLEGKIKAMEIIDHQVIGPVSQWLHKSGGPFKILVLPDHPTPVSLRTHTKDPVPFLLYQWPLKEETQGQKAPYSEVSARASGCLFKDSQKLIEHFLEGEL